MVHTPISHSYTFGDMAIAYLSDTEGHVGLRIIPAALADKLCDGDAYAEPLVQLYIRGDTLAGGAVNGHSLSGTSSPWGFTYRDQTVAEADGVTVISTLLGDGRGYRLRHVLTHRAGDRAVSVQTFFENGSDAPVTLEYLTSFALGNVTPFGGRKETDRIKFHRAASWWSAEGRILSETVEAMHMERSWSGHGTRVEKFGQILNDLKA